MFRANMALRIFVLVSVTSVLGAIVWRVMRWPPGNFGHAAGVVMILSALFVVAAPLVRNLGMRKATEAALGVCLIGAVAEIAGLYLGFFGSYVYTDQWQPALSLPGDLSFPVLLPLVWFIILATCYAYARQRLEQWPAVVAGALLATSTDLVAEPVLTGTLGFWMWIDPAPLLGAPVLNPVGWFLTSSAGCGWLALRIGGLRPAGQEPRWMLVLALLGVAVTGASHGEPRGLWSLTLAPLVLAWPTRPAT